MAFRFARDPRRSWIDERNSSPHLSHPPPRTRRRIIRYPRFYDRRASRLGKRLRATFCRVWDVIFVSRTGPRPLPPPRHGHLTSFAWDVRNLTKLRINPPEKQSNGKHRRQRIGRRATRSVWSSVIKSSYVGFFVKFVLSSATYAVRHPPTSLAAEEEELFESDAFYKLIFFLRLTLFVRVLHALADGRRVLLRAESKETRFFTRSRGECSARKVSYMPRFIPNVFVFIWNPENCTASRESG